MKFATQTLDVFVKNRKTFVAKKEPNLVIVFFLSKKKTIKKIVFEPCLTSNPLKKIV